MSGLEVNDIVEAMTALGPKRVETKEFNVEQFSPTEVQKLLQRNTPHPTFGTMTRVKVEPLYPDRCSCDCDKTGGGENHCV